MLDMKLDSGSLVIDDNNNMTVDPVIAEKLKEGFESNEDNKDKSLNNINIIKD